MKNPYENLNKEQLNNLEEYAEARKAQEPVPDYPQNAPTTFATSDYDNLIKWQLDIKEELVRIEHLLRKHVPKVDNKGNHYYAEPNEENKIFNEIGVNEIMNLLAWYLNKNIILSNFEEEDIKLRCKQFNNFLSDFIFNNYQRFGLNTQEKIKHYPMVVMNIVNTVEAAYNRALNGGERQSLREARQVTQTEPIQSPYGNQMYPQQRRGVFGKLNPINWGK